MNNHNPPAANSFQENGNLDNDSCYPRIELTRVKKKSDESLCDSSNQEKLGSKFFVEETIGVVIAKVPPSGAAADLVIHASFSLGPAVSARSNHWVIMMHDVVSSLSRHVAMAAAAHPVIDASLACQRPGAKHAFATVKDVVKFVAKDRILDFAEMKKVWSYAQQPGDQTCWLRSVIAGVHAQRPEIKLSWKLLQRVVPEAIEHLRSSSDSPVSSEGALLNVSYFTRDDVVEATVLALRKLGLLDGNETVQLRECSFNLLANHTVVAIVTIPHLENMSHAIMLHRRGKSVFVRDSAGYVGDYANLSLDGRG